MKASRYRVAVHVVPRQGLLDPQGKAVADALHSLGFSGVASVHVGRHLVHEVEAPDESDAREQTKRMCAQLLANPVTEDFEIASVSGA
jgi:phosphoribosylformylglycinamidine synthase